MKPSMMEKLWSVAASCVLVADFPGRFEQYVNRVPTCLLDCFRDGIALPMMDGR
jgi:hypothetical protein